MLEVCREDGPDWGLQTVRNPLPGHYCGGRAPRFAVGFPVWKFPISIKPGAALACASGVTAGRTAFGRGHHRAIQTVSQTQFDSAIREILTTREATCLVQQSAVGASRMGLRGRLPRLGVIRLRERCMGNDSSGCEESCIINFP